MTRLDRALAARGLARSRTEAQALIAAGQVRVDGQPAEKASQSVADEAALTVEGERLPFVSRGGLKLAAALAGFTLSAAGRTALDVGASTGGFTDCLLQRGAARVVSVDAGHGQMAPHIAADPRVESREGVNARHLLPGDFDTLFHLLVADLSFISLTLVLPALAPLLRPDGDMILLVKPQFEVGASHLGRGGIVRDPQHREQAVRRVTEAAAALGWERKGRLTSPILGGDGNEEYLLWLRLAAGTKGIVGNVAEAEAAQEPVDGEGEQHVIQGFAADIKEPEAGVTGDAGGHQDEHGLGGECGRQDDQGRHPQAVPDQEPLQKADQGTRQGPAGQEGAEGAGDEGGGEQAGPESQGRARPAAEQGGGAAQRHQDEVRLRPAQVQGVGGPALQGGGQHQGEGRTDQWTERGHGARNTASRWSKSTAGRTVAVLTLRVLSVETATTVPRARPLGKTAPKPDVTTRSPGRTSASMRGNVSRR